LCISLLPRKCYILCPPNSFPIDHPDSIW
jgi:hypothetical protein